MPPSAADTVVAAEAVAVAMEAVETAEAVGGVAAAISRDQTWSRWAARASSVWVYSDAPGPVWSRLFSGQCLGGRIDDRLAGDRGAARGIDALNALLGD